MLSPATLGSGTIYCEVYQFRNTNHHAFFIYHRSRYSPKMVKFTYLRTQTTMLSPSTLGSDTVQMVKFTYLRTRTTIYSRFRHSKTWSILSFSALPWMNFPRRLASPRLQSIPFSCLLQCLKSLVSQLWANRHWQGFHNLEVCVSVSSRAITHQPYSGNNSRVQKSLHDHTCQFVHVLRRSMTS